MAYADGIDSYFRAVKDRIVAFNSARIVKGMVDAMDWPSNDVVLEAFYLLTMSETPPGLQTGSIANPVTSHLLQWVWVIKGTDLKQGERKRNRGDRFRTAMQMKGELIQALYPYFAEKKSWSASPQGVWSGVSHDPVEYVTWTRPQFMQKLDKENGIIYGACSVHLTDMLDQIVA